MPNRPLLWITGIAAVAVGLSACGGGSATTATTPPPSRTTSAGAPTPTSSASPTTTGSGPRTVAEVKSALLALSDLPSGFAIEPAGGGDDGSFSSKDPKCASLVKLSNAKDAPGSKASAKVTLSGGQGGPLIEESIDALGSTDAVGALQSSFKSAVAACRQLTVTIPGQGRTTMKVAEVSAPKFGDHPFAARMTATGGPMAGLEITLVTSGVKDAIVSITFLGASPEDVDGATEAALGKAGKVLGGTKAGA